MSESEIAGLHATIDDLQAQLAELRELVVGGRATAPSAPSGATSEVVPIDESMSRRNALRAAGVLAAGAIAGGAGVLATAAPAAAATGAFVSTGVAPGVEAVGGNYQPAIYVSNADGTGGGIHSTAQVFVDMVGTNIFGALVVRANGPAPTFSAAGTGNTAFYVQNADVGAYIAAETNALHLQAPTQIRMAPVTQPPRTRSSYETVGSLVVDDHGDLWYCTATGFPGRWQKLGGSAVAGAFHPVTPGRVHDSRVSRGGPGPLVSSANRQISVADRILVGSTPALTDFIPAGATAISANVTVTTTSGNGYLAVNPGGDTTLHGSIINWTAAGQTHANGVTLTLNDQRQVQVLAAGQVGASADFIIDVLGYWT